MGEALEAGLVYTPFEVTRVESEAQQRLAEMYFLYSFRPTGAVQKLNIILISISYYKCICRISFLTRKHNSGIYDDDSFFC
ncbi:MAG: hypothetical protein CL797_12215 [Chromatiales bacterium]|nr:hypothetical protein [Chromatiales bacterium]